MPETTDEINSDCTFWEPAAKDLGYCTRCDCQISLPDAPEGLCAVCADQEDVG